MSNNETQVPNPEVLKPEERSPSEDPRPSRATVARVVLRVVLFSITLAVVMKSGLHRPNVVHSYYTGDPDDTMRDGRDYTCGCAFKGLEGTVADARDQKYRVYRCYDKSEVGTKTIVRFPQFNGNERILEILSDAYATEADWNASWRTRNDPGIRVAVQGHYLSSNDDSFLSAKFGDLFLNNPQERRRAIDATKNGGFLEFPSSYVAISFAFNCSDCTLCPLSSVQQLLKGLQTPGQPWGDCKYWGRRNQCGNDSEPQSYDAECVMYPIAAIPLNFAVREFLRKLQEMPGIDKIVPIQDRSAQNEISLDANILHMSFSRVMEEESVQLTFSEVAKDSPAFYKLLDLYPDFNTPCDKLPDVSVCTGTSVCNLFKDSSEDGYAIRCAQMTDASECQRDLLGNEPSINVTVDDDDNLWGEFGVREGNFSGLMCMNYTCQTTPVHSVVWGTASAMENDTFNQLLESHILNRTAYWSQLLGLCSTTYVGVTREIFARYPVYLETNCTQKWSLDHPRGYCWLTGRYKRITHLPAEPYWINPFSPNPTMFQCYSVAKQNLFIWIIVCFGVVFGWVGSIEILFTWILIPLALRFARAIRKAGKKRADEMSTHVSTDEEAQTTDLEQRGNDEDSEFLRTASERHKNRTSLQSQDLKRLKSDPHKPQTKIPAEESILKDNHPYRRYRSAVF